MAHNPKFLTSRQLAKQWHMHPGSLANLRSMGRGPRFIRIGRQVVYRRTTIENYEQRAWMRGEYLGVYGR